MWWVQAILQGPSRHVCKSLPGIGVKPTTPTTARPPPSQKLGEKRAPTGPHEPPPTPFPAELFKPQPPTEDLVTHMTPQATPLYAVATFEDSADLLLVAGWMSVDDLEAFPVFVYLESTHQPEATTGIVLHRRGETPNDNAVLSLHDKIAYYDTHDDAHAAYHKAVEAVSAVTPILYFLPGQVPLPVDAEAEQPGVRGCDGPLSCSCAVGNAPAQEA